MRDDEPLLRLAKAVAEGTPVDWEREGAAHADIAPQLRQLRALEAMAALRSDAAPDPLIGRTLSHFRILAKIGQGGMGVVYRAEDERLRRPVAFKLLPPELLDSEERRLRFQREARTAAAVTHPNIATVHEVGEDQGVVFIAMELVEGKTLRELIGGRPLPLRDALQFAVEMADGLVHAHEARVIHRDLKPDNVIVRPDQRVKILDFGLAKLLEERNEPQSSELSRLKTVSGEVTRAGRVLGTPAYMSPEQARGEPLDARSDIFSFGAMLYEMVTGRRPFHEVAPGDILSAVLRDHPLPAGQVDSEVPPNLERIIGKCLETDPANRYQDTRELAVDLRELKHAIDSGPQPVRAPEASATAQAMPGRARWAGLLGIRQLGMAALGLALAAGAIASWRALRVEPEIRSGDRIFVADFDDATGRAGFGPAVRDAFEGMLGGSKYVHVLSMDRVLEEAGDQGDGLPPRVGPDLARRLCRERGWAGYLHGRMTPKNGGIVLEADLYHHARERPVLSRSAVVANEEEVLAAIHEMALGIRTGLGESPQVLAMASPPTTRSLPAYQASVLGNRRSAAGRFEEALSLFRRAIEIDPGFVDAYTSLSIHYSVVGMWDEHRKSIAEARRRAAGMPDSVRLGIEALYLDSIYEFDAEIDQLKRLVNLHPYGGYQNWLMWVYGEVKQDPVGVELWARQAYDLNKDPINLAGLVKGLASQGKTAAIENLLQEFETREGVQDDVEAIRIRLDLGREAWDEVEETAGRLEHLPGMAGLIAISSRFDARLARGWLVRALELVPAVWRYAEANRVEFLLRNEVAVRQLWLEMRVRGRTRDLTQEQIAAARGNLLFLPDLAAAHVDVGESGQLDSLIAEHEAREKGSKSRFVREELQFARGCTLLIRGDARRARDLLEPLARNSILNRRHHVLERAYEALEMWPEAAAEYEEMLRHPNRKLIFYNPAVWVLGEFRLAELYERLGNQERARFWYKRFLADWKDADAGIPELAEARKRLSALTQGRAGVQSSTSHPDGRLPGALPRQNA